MSIIIYGIPNCDTIKRTRAWFAERGYEAQFHDYKKQGVPQAELQRWVQRVGWEKLLNRKGLLWRKLPAEVQAVVVDARTAHALMLREPSVIKRPVVVQGDALIVGFDPSSFIELRHTP